MQKKGFKSESYISSVQNATTMLPYCQLSFNLSLYLIYLDQWVRFYIIGEEETKAEPRP